MLASMTQILLFQKGNLKRLENYFIYKGSVVRHFKGVQINLVKKEELDYIAD